MPSNKAAILVIVFAFALAGRAAQITVGSDNKAASDRELAGLRGAVKTCTETMPPFGGEQKFTTVYDRTGRILSRTSGAGDSRWEETFTYAPDGRLLKTVSASAGTASKEITYSYDSAGRLVKISSQDLPEGNLEFQYDQQGRKTSVHQAARKRSGVALSLHNDGSDQSFQFTAAAICDAVETCKSVKTSYNERGHPSEAELLDAANRVITRMLRTFDAYGNVIAERQETSNVEAIVPPEMAEMKDKLNPAQLRAVGQLFAAMSAVTSAYAYDAQNRLTEVRTLSPMMGEETTSITYNDRGDRSEERVSRSGMAGFSGSITDQGAILPGPSSGGLPPEQSDTRYSYVYDGNGNWIQKTVETRSKPDEPFRILQTVSRELTYHSAEPSP